VVEVVSKLGSFIAELRWKHPIRMETQHARHFDVLRLSVQESAAADSRAASAAESGGDRWTRPPHPDAMEVVRAKLPVQSQQVSTEPAADPPAVAEIGRSVRLRSCDGVRYRHSWDTPT
jgi:hypothetical protein